MVGGGGGAKYACMCITLCVSVCEFVKRGYCKHFIYEMYIIFPVCVCVCVCVCVRVCVQVCEFVKSLRGHCKWES